MWLKPRGLPQSDDLIWHKLRDFFALPWFQRLWVVQEALLAKDLVLHLLDGTVPWDELIDLSVRLEDYRLTNITDGVSDTAYRQEFHAGRMPGRQALLSMEMMRSCYGLGHPSKGILFMVGIKLCRDPLYHVYAWYWLLPEAMRHELTPWRLLSAQTPLWIPAIELNHIILGAYPSLPCLALACTIERLPQLPSWCINIQSVTEIQPVAGKWRAGGRPLVGVSPHVATSRNGRQIYLRGFQTCQIVKALEHRWLDCRSPFPHPGCAALWGSRFSQCEAFATANSISIQELLRTLVMDKYDPTDSSIAPTDLEQHYDTLVECLYQ